LGKRQRELLGLPAELFLPLKGLHLSHYNLPPTAAGS
jgi:hypothetical protein